MAKKDIDILDDYLFRNPSKEKSIKDGAKASLVLKGEGLAAWEKLSSAEKTRWVEKTQAASFLRKPASKDENKLSKKKTAKKTTKKNY